MEQLRIATSSVINFGQNVAREHTTALAVGSTGLALATSPITGPAVLGTIGFSATGPVAASFAAAWQSSIGLVQAGSLFATLQGAAMGGAAAGTFTTASGIGIGMMGSAAVRTLVGNKSEHLNVESELAENDKYMEKPQTPDMLDSADKEFRKFLQIDMS
ncbi:hypothetical protein N8T08_004682 [Aspergillus melleus]|uniref:Uncharacterized protein n=1 Tax=Aspergillus melleus TaxID=138277 RepID=A0ACC3B4H0_9EURO|nr:hypothetical protein N8T08_004682 [Aspergillus melleus]